MSSDNSSWLRPKYLSTQYLSSTSSLSFNDVWKKLESLSEQGDVESSLTMILNTMDLTDDTNQGVSTLDENSGVVDVSEKLEELDLAGGGEKFDCKECGNSYKKPWTLKAHMKKKHRESDEPVIQKLHVCKVCEEVFVSKIALRSHDD